MQNSVDVADHATRKRRSQARKKEAIAQGIAWPRTTISCREREMKTNVHQPVTLERLERALVLAAYIVTRHGEVYSPIFERLERELVDMKARSDVRSRANRVLEAYTIDGAVKAIRLREQLRLAARRDQ